MALFDGEKKLACEVLLSAIFDYRAGRDKVKVCRMSDAKKNDIASARTFIFDDSPNCVDIRNFWCHIAEISVHQLRKAANNS